MNTGPLRIAVIDAATPLLQDAVICGHDRDYVAVMAWPSAAGAELGDGLADTLRDRLGAYNQRNPGSSTRIRRLLLLSEPPSVDGHEITHTVDYVTIGPWFEVVRPSFP